MNESHGNWTATLTLCNDSNTSADRPSSEHYILSQKNTTFVGRSTECQIVLRSKFSTVSRYHAKLEFACINDQFYWQICDLDTPNGTFVNDQRITGCHPLKSGDRLTLGKPKGAQFLFEYNLLNQADLEDLLHKEQLYKETYVPDLSEGTLFSPSQAEDFIEVQAASTRPLIIPAAQEESNLVDISAQNIPLSDVPETPLKRKKSIKPLLGLGLLCLVGIPLVYGLSTSMIGKKTKAEVLKAYIDNISTLLLNKNLDSLDPSDQEARKARESANGQIRTAFRGLDGPSKGSFVRFLYDSKIIRMQPDKLSATWRSLKKENVNIFPVALSSQNLDRKELVYSKQFNFGDIKPSVPSVLLLKNLALNAEAKKQSTDCKAANKSTQTQLNCSWGMMFKLPENEQPFLTPIQLSGADITGIVLKDAPLDSINLEGAYLSLNDCPKNVSDNILQDSYRNLTHWFSPRRCSADLSHAGLQNARLFRTVLRSADLSNAKLNDADLRQADLRGANLTGVQWTGAILKGACYLKDNWQQNFPAKGPDGVAFDPIAAGMQAMTAEESDPTQTNTFKECRAVAPSS